MMDRDREIHRQRVLDDRGLCQAFLLGESDHLGMKVGGHIGDEAGFGSHARECGS